MPGPASHVSMHPLRPQKHAAPGRSSSLGHGSGLCPHSPAIALGPSSTRPSTTMPAPDAGAENRAEDHSCIAARAVGRLRQREAVRVIGDANLAVEQRARDHA